MDLYLLKGLTGAFVGVSGHEFLVIYFLAPTVFRTVGIAGSPHQMHVI